MSPAKRLTTGVVASRRVVITLPAEDRRVRTVRRFTAAHLSRWGLSEPDRDSVVLVIGELAGNAARHGGTDMTVSLTLTGREICVDVVDTGASDCCRAHGDAEDEHGRGLGIVDHLASWAQFGPEGDGWRSRAGLRVTSAVGAGAAS
ncbi:ATP-binding protein [Streptomyces sp. HNM0663]|uniref:ATP-binding protein n=1 Tax=Streptomyces chengmaiensis TaxID=3040919 RepID=A0ABT6HVR4_9ACTN|nr:ATP-binding protein [Streptomyces chengmaiensis]MDH2392675.1 ATP-binding protein [Streptomyces chengmaiensis]